jgi:hypothetical protein
MLRDVELAKAICRAIEAAPTEMSADAILIDGQESWRVARHVELMVQAGLIDGLPGPRDADGQKVYRVRALTAYGQDFARSLDAPEVWQKLGALFPDEAIQQIPLRVIAGLAPRMMKA